MCDTYVLIGPLCLFPLTRIYIYIPSFFHEVKDEQLLLFLPTFQMPFIFMSDDAESWITTHRCLHQKEKEEKVLKHEFHFISRCIKKIKNKKKKSKILVLLMWIYVLILCMAFWKYLGNINHSTDYLYSFKWTSVI